MGPLPFRYFGVPLSSKKLDMNHFLILIEKIIARIKHSSVKLLIFVGRVQLIKSVLFSKQVIKQAEAIFIIFLWSSNENVSKKSPISWQKVCSPKKQGGFNIICLEEWNKAKMIKLVWNLNGKSNTLWIK